jgi:hypothetical protein
MARSFFYLIDGLNAERGQRLKRALEQLDEVNGVKVHLDHGVIEVQASRDPEAQVKMACTIVGTIFRVKVKKRSLC